VAIWSRNQGSTPLRRFEVEEPLGRRHRGAAHEFVVVERVVGNLAGVTVQAEPAGLEGPARLLHRLGERPAERHDLADRLHLRAEHGRHAGELLEGESGDLDHDVVDGRLEAGRRLAGDVVHHLVEAVADGELGGDLGDGEPGRLRGQRRRT
jgi:hypothetical protein